MTHVGCTKAAEQLSRQLGVETLLKWQEFDRACQAERHVADLEARIEVLEVELQAARDEVAE